MRSLYPFQIREAQRLHSATVRVDQKRDKRETASEEGERRGRERRERDRENEEKVRGERENTRREKEKKGETIYTPH